MVEKTLLTSQLLFEKLKEFEGCRLEAYQDAAGVWTIGYGHTYNVRKGDKISQFWAEELLRRDIEMAERQVLRLNVCKTQAQLDALVSFVFNLGIDKLKRSTLLQLIEAQWPPSTVIKEWKKWNRAGGVFMRGLLARRTWEVKRFYNPSPDLDDVREQMETKGKEG